MNEVDDKRVFELFTASSRELAPVAAGDAVQVLYVPVSDDPSVTKLCALTLSKAELQRAERFAAEADKARFIQRRAFRRYCAARSLGLEQALSDVGFEETDKGQPYLANAPHVCFSFSSCQQGIVGAWSFTHGVGIDMEDQTRDSDLVTLARRYFSATEANTVEGAGGSERLLAFFQFWSLKEAALKSIGEGLPFGLDAFEFELRPKLRVLHAPPGHGGPGQFKARLVEQAWGCLALVLHDRRWPTKQGRAC